MDFRKYLGWYINVSAIEAYPYYFSSYSLFDNTCELSVKVAVVPARRIGENSYCINMALSFSGQVKSIRRDRQNSWDGDFMNVRYPTDIETKANNLLEDILIELHSENNNNEMPVVSWQFFLLNGLFNRNHNTVSIDPMAFDSGILSAEKQGLAIWYNHDHSIKVSLEYNTESLLVISLKCETSGGNLTIASDVHSEFCDALRDYLVLSYKSHKSLLTSSTVEPVNVAKTIQPIYDWLDNKQVLSPVLLHAVKQCGNNLDQSVIHQILNKVSTLDESDDDWLVHAMLIPALCDQYNSVLADEDICILNLIENKAAYLFGHYSGQNQMATSWANRIEQSIKQYKTKNY